MTPTLDFRHVLSKLAPHLPEIQLEALEAARNIGDESYRAKVLSSLVPHLPENLLLEVLETARNIGDEFYRADVLSKLILKLHKINSSFSYPLWCEMQHSLVTLKRKEFLNKIIDNSDIINNLGGSQTFKEITVAIADISRWFP